MYLKNISKSSTATLIFLLLLIIVSVSVANTANFDKAEIKIIYPKPDQTISAVDSTFILGNVPSIEGLKLNKFTINNSPVPIHKDGGFIAFIPITPGIFVFYLEAEYSHKKRSKDKSASISNPYKLTKALTVNVPQPLKTLPLDSLVISGEYKRLANFVTFNTGDLIKVSFQGTPNCEAWFSIDSIADSIPMSESDPRLQPYWGESIFGGGAVPDSMKIKGIYSGFYKVPYNLQADSVSITYHLTPPNKTSLAWKLLAHKRYDRIEVIQLLSLPDTILTLESSSKISLNSDNYPFTVRFIDSVQIIRFKPRKGYFSIFQHEGIEALAVGEENGWYRLKLSETQYAYAQKKSVEKLSVGILPPKSFLSSVRAYDFSDKVILKFPLSGKHPFKVIEDNNQNIRVHLYGVTSDTDWIRYDLNSEIIDLASWSQIEPDLFELNISLTKNIWGYDTYYSGNTFCLQLNKAPENLNTLKNKIIVIDPGHSSDKGSIGTTGLTEADANLAISLMLRKELENKGAKVIMTRADNSHVDLYDRPAIAKANDADLFISIHNNALPDGVNPFENNGTSIYYYHPHSINLARAIHEEMLKEIKLNDYGLFHGNLAVNRPTQYPAVLVECAFMILPEQEALLKTEKFQKKTAKAIRKGIETFLKGYDDD